MRKINIAIDGHSSTGKSSTAKQLADHLGYLYIDSGAMYRAITLYALKYNYIDKESGLDEQQLIEALPQIDLEFRPVSENSTAIFLNGQNVSQQIRQMEVSNWVSPVATISEVRQKLVSIQRYLGRNKGVVMDGRDIGTVVFPDAELKIFMTASPEERARRRHLELQERGEAVSYNEVLENVNRRDLIDSNRDISPLLKADDAIMVDNTDLNREEQFNLILRLAQDRIVGRA